MFANKISDCLKIFDLHGAEINFTFKNKSSYQTPLGGVLTIISRLGILAYFLVIVSNIINKERTITITANGKSPTQDFQSYKIEAKDFDIAFSLSFLDNKPHLEEKLNYSKYYDIRIQYAYAVYQNDSKTGLVTKVLTTKDIPLTNCTLDRFAGQEKEMIAYGINQLGWFCPENINFTLEGQLQSLSRNRYRLIVNMCQNSTTKNTCASQEEITAFANAARIQIATLNSYFDENEFSRMPVKRFLSVEQFPVALNFLQTYERRMRKNTIITKDSWVSSAFDNQQYVFYEDIQGLAKIKTAATEFIIFTYGCDAVENTIIRKVLSLADAAAIAGGFAGVMIMLARIIASLYSKPLFYYEVFSRLYQFDPSDSMSPEQDWKTFKANSQKNKFAQIKNILNRRNYIKLNPIKEYVTSIFCMCQSKRRGDQRIKSYQQGMKALRESLDIVKVLRSLKRMKILERVLLKDYQRKLITYSHKNLINHTQLKQKKNSYEGKRMVDQSLQELIEQNNKTRNRNILKEILGFNEHQTLMTSGNLNKSKSKVLRDQESFTKVKKFNQFTKPSSQNEMLEMEQDSVREFITPQKLGDQSYSARTSKSFKSKLKVSI